MKDEAVLLATDVLPSVETRKFVKKRIEALDTDQEPPPPPAGVVLHSRRCPELTSELLDEVRKRMLTGVPAERCAQAMGVMPRVWRRWLDYGRAGLSELHVRLLDVVERTEAEFEVHAMLTISKAGQRWQATAWKLERLYPDRYALRTKQEITGSGGGPIVIAPGRAQLPPEDPE